MVIEKQHAEALEQLMVDKEANKPFTTIEPVDENTYLELEAQGLARLEKPLQPTPTYFGLELATLLRNLYKQEALRPPAEWEEGWRWVGSEIIAMLDAANRAGIVGPLAVAPLMERGFAEKVHDRKRKVDYVGLTEAGERMLEMFLAIEPILQISSELADAIRKTPMGPTESARLTTAKHEEHMLEAMRLVAYSVPNSDIFAFTALGQAVKKTLELGGFGQGVVLSEEILRLLAAYADGEEVTPEAVATLQALAYVGPEGELLPASDWALEAYRLWREGARKEVWSFSIEAEEAEVLKTIQQLWEKAEQNPEEVPTFKNLRREMIDRKIKQYKALIERYGRKLDEMPQKFQQIAQKFMEAKDLQRWYDSNFDLREVLYSLESFNLIESTVNDKGKEIFVLTDFGQEVLEDQTWKERDVTSTGVKSITMTRKTFSAPNLEWWQQARVEELVGTAEPTRSGLMYARLAETITRKPHLSRYELMIFHRIPNRGMTLDEVYEEFKDRIPEERIRWALEKLEARHFIDILPDKNIVETPAGELLDQALAGVPEGFGNPINTTLYRLLKALVEVGTLYVKEKKVRILPRNIKEALKRSGLAPEVFENALEAARAAGLVGRNSVNSGGLLIVEVMKKMNPQAGEIVSYAE